LVLNAELEKRPEPFELLAGRDRGDVPGLSIPAYLIDGQGCDGPALEFFLEFVCEQPVFSE